MTISSETSKNTYSGNGSTTVFQYTFRILDEDEISVQLKNNSTGVITTQTITTHYTVSGVGESAGGNITFVTAPASGYTVILVRDTTFTQETDYEEYAAFPAASHENALDKLTMLAQQLNEALVRTLKVDPAVSGFEGQVVGTPAASNIIRVNSDGDGLEFSTAVDLGGYTMPAGTGILYQSAEGTAIAATLAGTANQITITESPTGTFTFSIPDAVTLSGKVITGGTFTNITLSGTLTASGTVTLSGTFSGGTVNGVTGIASQTDQETATSTTTTVTPGRQHYHYSAAKAWCRVGTTGNIQRQYNVSSVTDNGTGHSTFNFTTAFSDAAYVTVADVVIDTTLMHTMVQNTGYATTAVVIKAYNTAGTLTDPTTTSIACFGDQ